MTHLHWIPGTADMHCQQVESNYVKPGALFNRRTHTGGDMVEFLFCALEKVKKVRIYLQIVPTSVCQSPQSLPPWWHPRAWRGRDGNLARFCRLTPLLSQAMVKVPTVFTGSPVSHSQDFWCVYVFIIPLALQIKNFRLEKWNKLTKAIKELVPDSKTKSRWAHEAINHRWFWHVKTLPF